MIMTMRAEFRTCPRCKRKYSWNPDVGKMWCPTCGPGSIIGKAGKTILDILLNKPGKKK